jgi:RNA polymerase sigma-70 factor (ECF subfamily)
MRTSTPADIRACLEQARAGDAAALGLLLEARRGQLRQVALRQLTGRLAVRADASDVVQQTFLEAHRDFQQFCGQDEAEWLAWLNRVLDNTVARVVRDHAVLQKRNVHREQPLLSPEGSTSEWAPSLAASQPTPSQKVVRTEEQERLLAALEHLPEDQRKAVRLRHLEELPLADIAARLGRSPAATAGLIKRGLQSLRKHLGLTAS